MKEYVIPQVEPPSLAVAGTDKFFPVRRVYCIGRNYAAHSIEMGGDPDRDAPFFFQKNPNNLDGSGVFHYPVQSVDVHHEIEMLVALSRGGTSINVGDALDHVYGYAVALDMTRRDLQAQAKKQSRPWEIAKAFEGSAPCGLLHPVTETGHLTDGTIELTVNDKLRQTGNLNQMVWKVPEMISYLSDYVELAPGDVILSGTPAGVGEVARGDALHASIDKLSSLTVKVL